GGPAHPAAHPGHRHGLDVHPVRTAHPGRRTHRPGHLAEPLGGRPDGTEDAGGGGPGDGHPDAARSAHAGPAGRPVLRRQHHETPRGGRHRRTHVTHRGTRPQRGLRARDPGAGRGGGRAAPGRTQGGRRPVARRRRGPQRLRRRDREDVMARYRRRLCLAVDLRHYSRHSYPEQEDAQYRLRLVVEHALRRARVLRVRAQQQLQGDGQLVVFPAGTDAVRAVPELVLGLRDGLYQSNRAPGAFGRLRMRAALGLGAVSRADRGYLGDCVVLVNRLVDADVVRGALEAEEHSDLALAVPDELYREVILPHGDRLPSVGFRQTDVVVPGKDFACRAWLHVPRLAPARDAGTEPVIWGHSPGRTALREF